MNWAAPSGERNVHCPRGILCKRLCSVHLPIAINNDDNDAEYNNNDGGNDDECSTYFVCVST